MTHLIHLSPAQRAALIEVLKNLVERPSPEEHIKICAQLEKIPAPKPKQSMQIPGTLPGRHGIERWPAPLFIPKDCKASDIPEGLALVPIHDSADNHALHNAATSAWVRIWNGWYGPAEEKLIAALQLEPETIGRSRFRKKIQSYYSIPVEESLLETLWESFKENDYSHPALRRLFGDGCTPIGLLPPGSR